MHEHQVPPGWAMVGLGEVAALGPKVDISDLRDEQMVHFVPMAAVSEDFGGIDTTQLRPLSEVRKGYTSFAEGDVLFAKITPCMENGKGGVVPTLPQGYAFGSTEFHVIRPHETVTPSWLAHFLSQPVFRRIARQNMTGSAGQLRVPTKWLASVKTPIPPLAEQTRIVAKLEELLSDLDAGVAELKAAQAKLAQYRQSLLKAAVEGALTADWRTRHTPQETGAQLLARILTERRARWESRQLARFQSQGKTPPKGWQGKYPEPAAPDTRELPELPEGWVWASVEQVSSGEDHCLAIGPFGSNLKVEDYRESGVPLIFVRNIRSGLYGGAHTKYITPQKALELDAHSVEAGDVLITKMGEPPGDADIYPDSQPLAVITADCIKVRCNRLLFRPEFLKAVVNSSIGKRQIHPMTKGVAQKKVSLGRFSKLAVPVPPIREQEQVIDALTAAEGETHSMEVALNDALRQSTAQRQNLLKAAFSGQLVPQDPADEPAGVLLERIRTSRSLTPTGRRTRKRSAQESV